MPDQEAETVACAFYTGWICRFGPPRRLTTDQGRQFESYLFQSLSCLTGTTHLRTTAYHPQANGMVERLHRQLKADIRCHQNDTWTQILPTVLLGIRASWKDDLEATSVELVYGEPLRLPEELLAPSERQQEDPAFFIRQLRGYLQQLRPAAVERHGTTKTFVFKNLATSKHVFIRHDAVKNALQMPLKPAYIVKEDNRDHQPTPTTPTTSPNAADQTQPPPTPQEQPNRHEPAQDERTPDQPTTRRSGRRVRFAERYQAGFS
ncbi:uncharacterized protein LOC103315938 [Nasonia vitripennis]|uniref:Integrase catalytic domain-containing protein n=1 Tax=Nasonia vitripennis TaxID=7425 RepID=A0A7M7Q3N9_NASVI|nr:uncharacterized protein LOC103315938 [Nasonia vitripennis]